MNLFKDNSKLFFLTCLPDNISAIISVFLMMGVCIVSYHMNRMIDVLVGEFVTNGSKFSLIMISISFLAFLIGILIEKKKKIIFLLKQLTSILILYIFIGFSCFYYNLLSLVASNDYRDEYNVHYYYADIYIEDHPDEDYDDIVKYYKKKLYLESLLHVVSLAILVYYYNVTTVFINKKEKEYNGENEILFEKFNSSNRNSNINSNITTNETATNTK
ncbi:hypothetical protein BCR36DRAFT_354711 [Piromyces finnis]|uniref:Uncharacterized protein n=1 Tax=Piromyces finnis TaxID=1754191 RepID=A0A1Y1V6G7_9FUNG|nr:hypothetical protein BCR36DRAFT_354711 [Piromyces finnis]|eukprot:ORX48398.1 hypothetical protein BCR36DRAFT_354711 [Piromyces finnis]